MRLGVKTTVFAAALALAGGTAASADPVDAELVINGEIPIITEAPAPAHLKGHLDKIYSGWRFRSEETRALEADDFDNPAMVFVEQGRDLYNTPDGEAGKSCADCHGDVSSFKGLRTVLPRVDGGKLMSMEDYINKCRTERMKAEPWKWSGAQMQSVVALIGLQSRGMPVNVKIDGEAKPFWEKGKELYYTRVGQLDMACASCHEENYGKMIRADHLSQGQINGFPTYRLKNAKLNSIHARFKGCMKNIRAEPYKEGSPEFHALELYVASRGNGLSVETPSVRN